MWSVAMSLALAALFLALIGISVVTDLHRMIIPNWLNAAVAALFFPAALVAGFTSTEIAMHALAGAVAFAVCMALF
jgi:prepilin peptidase CpaA